MNAHVTHSTNPAMSQTTTAPARSATHNTFTIERRVKAPAERVYAAFADPVAKAKWFAGTTGQWTPDIREFDFRVGGHERLRGTWHTGMVSDFQATYFDIVPNERIVYTYDMYVNTKKLSVSLATIQVIPEGATTRLVITEQGVFFDGNDDAANRERGTQGLMDKVVASVEAG